MSFHSFIYSIQNDIASNSQINTDIFNWEFEMRAQIEVEIMKANSYHENHFGDNMD